MKIKLHAELIFIWRDSHSDLFWSRGTRELGNGLLMAFLTVNCQHNHLPPTVVDLHVHLELWGHLSLFSLALPAFCDFFNQNKGDPGPPGCSPRFTTDLILYKQQGTNSARVNTNHFFHKWAWLFSGHAQYANINYFKKSYFVTCPRETGKYNPFDHCQM